MQLNSIKILLTNLVVIHLVGNLWHGGAHATLEIFLPEIKTAFVIIVILFGPVVGAVLTWTRFVLPGSWIVGVSMVSSLVFSVYHHYVLISPDNVEHLPLGTPSSHVNFSDSAGFIALIALLAALFAFYAVGKLQSSGSGTLQT